MNKENINKDTNKSQNNKKTNNVTADSFEKDIEKMGILIQFVKVIFMIIAIGIFVFVIGKSLINAIKIVDIEELNSKNYTNIIEEMTEK